MYKPVSKDPHNKGFALVVTLLPETTKAPFGQVDCYFEGLKHSDLE